MSQFLNRENAIYVYVENIQLLKNNTCIKNDHCHLYLYLFLHVCMWVVFMHMCICVHMYIMGTCVCVEASWCWASSSITVHWLMQVRLMNWELMESISLDSQFALSPASKSEDHMQTTINPLILWVLKTGTLSFKFLWLTHFILGLLPSLTFTLWYGVIIEINLFIPSNLN